MINQVTNIFSNCDNTIMGNSSTKDKDKDINGINIPKVKAYLYNLDRSF